MKRMLVQTQLSNYDSSGKFILECDSGWNMVMGRVREMLKLNSNLQIDIMGPVCVDTVEGPSQVVTRPEDINPELFASGRVRYLEHRIIPNALATRYDFSFDVLSKKVLNLPAHREDSLLRYDAVYVNDPMQLRNFKAMFHTFAGYQPKFYVHSHFVDVPSCPKFPVDASLWHGQLEAAIKADWNFWQCSSALAEFNVESRKVLRDEVVDMIMAKSTPWDDGYSASEITSPINLNNVRFDITQLQRWRDEGKVIIFVPNRIGGRGRSSDYTNCGKFMFDLLPKLRKLRSDFVVLAGNPNQKFLNSELVDECGRNGYVSLVPDALNRDEFKAIVSRSHIAVGLYDQDTYGGTVARECIEMGCLPLWLDNFEYSSIAKESGNWPYLAKPDFSDLVLMTDALIHVIKNNPEYMNVWRRNFQKVVKERCSYESTTPVAMRLMQLM